VLHLLAYLSLVVCVTTLVFWFSARGKLPDGGLTFHIGSVQVHSANGEAEFIRFPRGAWLVYWLFPAGSSLTDSCRWHVAGFGTGDMQGSRGIHRVVIPMWFIVLTTFLFDAWWLVGVRRTSKGLQRGKCIKCGYDLRATPERCPECGMEVKQ
jgi:hypothetical protein